MLVPLRCLNPDSLNSLNSSFARFYLEVDIYSRKGKMYIMGLRSNVQVVGEGIPFILDQDRVSSVVSKAQIRLSFHGYGD